MSDRDAAYRRLRTVFAEVYDELRRRGHEVLVNYEDPGNPYYIPKILEVDGVPIDVYFSVLAPRLKARPQYVVEVYYAPSPAAKRKGARFEHRSEDRAPFHVGKLAELLLRAKRREQWR